MTDIIITSALPGGDVYSYVVGQQRKPLLVLARQNNTLFMEVAKALRCPLVRSIAFIGGVDAGCGGTRDIMDLYRLWAGRPRDEIESPLIAKWGRNTSARPYGGFVAFKAAMEETREPAWGVKCGLVEAHGHAVPGIIEQMRAKSVSEVCRADVVFSTTHKAKGASWGHVYMSGAACLGRIVADSGSGPLCAPVAICDWQQEGEGVGGEDPHPPRMVLSIVCFHSWQGTTSRVAWPSARCPGPRRC